MLFFFELKEFSNIFSFCFPDKNLGNNSDIYFVRLLIICSVSEILKDKEGQRHWPYAILNIPKVHYVTSTKKIPSRN